ncbi:MAG: hypothetical protein IJ104_11590 [Methanobrevibacter sp.]|nr:hypothetical protein [Methanobrevibacter sp.]
MFEKYQNSVSHYGFNPYVAIKKRIDTLKCLCVISCHRFAFDEKSHHKFTYHSRIGLP